MNEHEKPRRFRLLRGRRADRAGDYPTFGHNDRRARIGCIVLFVLAVMAVIGFGLAKVLWYREI